MSGISRRRVLALGIGTLASVASRRYVAWGDAERPTFNSRGRDLTGWDVVLGDALYAPPDIEPVSPLDIRTEQQGSESILIANVQSRPRYSKW